MKNKLKLCVLWLILALLWQSAFAAAVYSYGSQNENIRAMQEKLKALGFYTEECIGLYDDATQMAVENFRIANGMSADGAVDPQMLEKLDNPNAVSKQEYIEAVLKGNGFESECRPGDSGKVVKKMQTRLAELKYFSGNADGKYNDETKHAVCMFQLLNFLEVTGEADMVTLNCMASAAAIPAEDNIEKMTLKFGSQGNDVKKMQLLLLDMGYFTGECSGTYGKKTQEAVSEAQRVNGLTVTGECDAELQIFFMTGDVITRMQADRIEATRQVMLGDDAACVVTVKAQLNALGYYHGETGTVFTQELAQAVKFFQDANGLNATGIADTPTREKLNGDENVDMAGYKQMMLIRELRLTDANYGVELLQQRLQELGYYTDAITGVYTKGTENAVMLFQKLNLLIETGIADESTRRLMNSDGAMKFVQAQESYYARMEASQYSNMVTTLCRTATECVSKPFEAGKAGAESFGSSGLVYFCFKTIDVEIQPTLQLQLEQAREMDTWNTDGNLTEVGQQVFWYMNGSTYTGICVSSGEIVYASAQEGKVVQVNNILGMDGCEFVGSVSWF